MKKIILILVFLILIKIGFSQNSIIDNQFEKFCYQISEYFEEANIEKINGCINQEIGIYTLLRYGVPDDFIHEKKLELNPTYYYNYSKSEKKYIIEYESLPNYVCYGEDEQMKWEKNGIFVDTTKINNQLTKIINFKEKERYAEYEVEFKNKIKEIEENSRKIIFTDIGKGLILYITLIQGKWYLTIIDQITTDCSA